MPGKPQKKKSNMGFFFALFVFVVIIITVIAYLAGA